MFRIVTDLTALAICTAVGLGVLIANSRRPINQAFALLAATVTVWILALTQTRSEDAVFWITLANITVAALPWNLWLVKEAATGRRIFPGGLRAGWRWMAVAALLMCLAPPLVLNYRPDDPFVSRVHRLLWISFHGVLLVEYVILIVQTVRTLRKTSGLHYLELQIVALGGVAGAVCGEGLVLGGALAHEPAIRHCAVLPVIAFYALTAYAVTSRRVFEARYLFAVALRWLVTAAALMAVLVPGFVVLPNVTAKLPAAAFTGVAVLLVLEATRRIRWFRPTLALEDASMAARRAIHQLDEIAALDELVPEIEQTLATWGRAETATVYQEESGRFVSWQGTLPPRIAGCLATQKSLTPEAIARQRDEAIGPEVTEFMRTQNYGVITGATNGPRWVIVAIGQRIGRRPFTEPEIAILQDLASLIQSTLARAQSVRKLQESEQLATIGRLGMGIAHEIRNPLSTLKNLAQISSDRWNDPKYRDLMQNTVPGEISRIERLVTDLMDLSRPRPFSPGELDIDEVVAATLQLLRTKAADERVELVHHRGAGERKLFADSDAMKQVLFNLVLNAIHAASRVAERARVEVRTQFKADMFELLVGDNGPGIPEAVQRRLFLAFSTAGKAEGIGLGLFMTRMLVKQHHGSIVVRNTGPGGTTFAVSLPLLAARDYGVTEVARSA